MEDIIKRFQYEILDKIHGEPTLEGILRLYQQLKVNAQCIFTKLGGGQYGYLALVIALSDYIKLDNATTFTKPQDPGIFSLTSETTSGTVTRSEAASATSSATSLTAEEIATKKAEHEEKQRLYEEWRDVGHALKTQLCNAVEPEFLDDLRNVHTYAITEDIPTIMNHLTDMYGDLSYQDLQNKEDDLRAYAYDPSTPVDAVFNKVRDFGDISQLAKNKKTDTQLIALAFTIFQKTGAFSDALADWLDETNTTFANFKKHMRKQHRKLKKVGALELHNSTLNINNVLKEMEERQRVMESGFEEKMQVNLMETLRYIANTNEENEDPNRMQHDQMNNATSEQDLMKIIKNLNAKVDELSKEKGTGVTKSKTNPRSGKAWKRYCYTHGCCDHWGKNCNNPGQNHVENATFKDRKGGSNKGCLPSTS